MAKSLQIPWGSWTHFQVITTRNNFRASRPKLLPFIPRNSNLSINNQIHIFTPNLRTLLTYTCMMLSYAAKKYVKLLLKIKIQLFGKFCPGY